MDVMNIVGNRPQFIKLAPVSRELRKRNIQEVIIHTGQHYDNEMSDIFFEELEIPKPMRNLEVGSGSHAQVTGKAMIEIEKVLQEFSPKCVILYGDTNSTLAAALATVKLSIPILHIEAGPRTYNRRNPEECNRVVVDHVADYLCTPNKISEENLLKEGIPAKKIIFTGDVMYDEFLHCLSQKDMEKDFYDFPENYALMTWHRQENTCSKERMEKIIAFIEKVKFPIVMPLHPRTNILIDNYGLRKQITSIPFLKVISPVGYREMIYLLNQCKFLISDSGGASKEASFVGKKCIYLLNLNVWPDLEKAGYIKVVDIDNKKSIEDALAEINNVIRYGNQLATTDVFGDGNASKKVVDIVEKIIVGER